MTRPAAACPHDWPNVAMAKNLCLLCAVEARTTEIARLRQACVAVAAELRALSRMETPFSLPAIGALARRLGEATGERTYECDPCRGTGKMTWGTVRVVEGDLVVTGEEVTDDPCWGCSGTGRVAAPETAE